MQLSLRAKLLAIVGTAASSLVLLWGSEILIGQQRDAQLRTIEQTIVPRVELRPQLEKQFQELQHALQDSVAASDSEALETTRGLKGALLKRLAAAGKATDPAARARFEQALEVYYAEAHEVSRRMIAGETGEELVVAMASMQAKRAHAVEALERAAVVDKAEIADAFRSISRANATAASQRLGVGVACFVLVGLLSLWLSRGMLKGLVELSAGFARFGTGKFDERIPERGADEFTMLARHANRMAENLKQLSEERDRDDWLKLGTAGLAQELGGELGVEEVATRALGFLTSYLGARVGALYAAEPTGELERIGQHALDGESGEAPPRFRMGEGLVGQAALGYDMVVIDDPPAGYLRIRSALGESTPQVVVLLPLVHTGRVTGVLELGFFQTWSALRGELLLACRETLAVSLEVARVRAATRRLLRETQQQAAKLAAQEEELQATNEELLAQQEELQQTNEELTQQATELDAQRRTLQQQNTELADTRIRLEQKARELTTVSKYKSQFLANMSHELRTPLNSMLLLSNLLAENEGRNLTDKQVEFARTINNSGKDLLALINQVLDLAKVESGKQELRPQRVPFQDLAEHAQFVFGPLAQEKGLEFVVEIAPGLPEAMRVDPQKLQQILNNLLANAIKFTSRGRVALRIGKPTSDARWSRTDLSPESAVVFAVSDTGSGIAPEHQERIFRPFEQVDGAADRRYGGTGLGLSIARELTALLGGELQLRSALRSGSTFSCYLPLDGAAPRAVPAESSLAPPPAPAMAPATAAPARAAPVNGSARQGGELLVIEDDPAIVEVLGEIITGQGLDYSAATDGATGLARARQVQPVGIILDINLPDMTGWQVMEALRADPVTAAIPVHFVSGLDAAERGLAMGAVGYLTKPATRQDLVRVVEALAPKRPERQPRLLIVEEERAGGDSLLVHFSGENLETVRVTSGAAALELLARERYSCMILDLSLPDMDGLEFLRTLQERWGAEAPSAIVYTDRALNKVEVQRLQTYADAVVLKEGSSAERLLEEVRLFVRRLRGGGARRRSVPPVQPLELRLTGRKVLVADDDMRNVYALSALLRAKGAEVLVADTGRSALNLLGENPDVDAVLMDIMMPEMDGYEAMRSVRQDTRFVELPMIALTAKAMKGDPEKCIAAGASDYLPKPVDAEQLLVMLHSHLARRQ